MYKKLLGITAAITLTIGLAACGSNEAEGSTETGSVGESVDYKIIGIDPGAGIMDLAINTVLPEYGLDKWEIVEGSGAAMTAELAKAINNEEPIIVTGWIPHWKFNEFDLKMLEDPKELFGGEGYINTVVRQGLEEDLPNAYKFLDQFHWEPEHMQDVMVKIHGGMSEQEAAEKWAAENTELVNSWIEGVEPGNGEEIKITYVAWADSIASASVVKYVAESELNFEVNLVQVEAGPLWAAVAEGSADGMLTAALPVTHAAYYEEYKDDIVDLGTNFTGTQNAFVVPAYMEIDSIEDLQDAE